MYLVTVAWRNLERRPARSFLTVLGLSLSVSAIVSLVGLANSLEASFLALYLRRGADLVVQRRGGASQLSKGLPASLGKELSQLAGVKEVIGSLMDMVAFEDQQLFMVLVNGWSADSPVLQRVDLIEGRGLVAGDEQRVMLGRILAANLGKHAGDSIELYAQPFEVVGVFESFSVYENGAAFLLLEELQRQMDRPGQVTGFVVQAEQHGDPRAIAELRSRIEALNDEIAATPCAEFVNSLSQMKVARTMAWLTSIIAAVMGAIGVLNTMTMAIFERRPELGALRAMGWCQRRVLQLIVFESLLLAAAGAVLGSATGVAVLVGLSRWPPTSGLVQGDISWTAVSLGITLALIMAALGALYPAWKSVRDTPMEALRSG